MQQGHHRIHLPERLSSRATRLIASTARSSRSASRVICGVVTEPSASVRAPTKPIRLPFTVRIVESRTWLSSPSDDLLAADVLAHSQSMPLLGSAMRLLKSATPRSNSWLPTAEIVNPHALAISSVGWSFSTADSCGEPPTKSPVDTGIILPGLWLSATVKAVALSAPRSICP